MATALSNGEISFGQAAVVARAASEVGPEAAPELERRAVEAAEQLDPSQLRQFTDRLSCKLNQEAFLADQKRAYELRRLDLGQAPDGMWIVDGRLDHEGGAYLSTALEVVLGPRSKDDERSPTQRRADALVDLTRRVLEDAHDGETSVRGTGGQRPHLTLTASVQTLRGEPGAPGGELLDRFPVPPETVRRIACDAALTPMVVDETGDPLDFGRTIRTASPPLRRAVVLGDKPCPFPGCDRSAPWCDVHHLDEWARGGRTRKADPPPVFRPPPPLPHHGGWSPQPRTTPALGA